MTPTYACRVSPVAPATASCRRISSENGSRSGRATRALRSSTGGRELDRSGGRMRRPELDRILDRIRRGETEGVVVADRSRFARTLPGALLAIQEIRDAGGAFISSDGFDSSTPEGALFLHQMMAFAQFELDRIRQTWAICSSRAVADGVRTSRQHPTGTSSPGGARCWRWIPSAARWSRRRSTCGRPGGRGRRSRRSWGQSIRRGRGDHQRRLPRRCQGAERRPAARCPRPAH